MAELSHQPATTTFEMLDVAEEEPNMVSNEGNENPIDLFRLSELDSSSHEAVQPQFSDDVSSESVNKGSGNVISPMEANPVWRHKRSLDDEPECYTGLQLTYRGLNITYPECRTVARFTACSSSIGNHGKRKCEPSHFVHYPQYSVIIPKKCSCAL